MGRQYSRVMGTGMKKLVQRHVEQISKNTKINIDEVMKTQYLHEFDRWVRHT